MDLLDARGYEIVIKADGDKPLQLEYMGAVKRQYPERTYDEDTHVVCFVEQVEFTEEYKASLKDVGIRESGLRVVIKGTEGTKISLMACGEILFEQEMDSTNQMDVTCSVEKLCMAEKAYLEKVHEVLYCLLEKMDTICKKHDISYYLVFGGLLGALRYEEIIPWDDDIDVAMTRDDFEKFKQVAPAELGTDFMYLDCADMGGGAFLDYMCRLVYMKEEVPVNVFRKVSGKCRKEIENHLPLDIFVLDKASDNKTLHKIHMYLIKAVYGFGMGHRAYIDKEEYNNRDRFTRISVACLSTIGKCLPVKFIFWLHDKISMMYHKKDTKDYFMSNGFLPFIHTRYAKEWFTGNDTMKLGAYDVIVPSDVPAYLKRAYYDYYHYPPMNKRVPGHSPESDGVF